VHREAVFVKSGGTVVDTSGVNLPVVPPTVFDALWVILRHRNHLDVMSDTVVALGNGLMDHSFLASGAATGTNPMKDLGGGVFGMYAGDGEPDGTVQALDFNIYLAETEEGASGYNLGDYNLDGQTQALDFNLYLANTLAGATSGAPGLDDPGPGKPN
jgi:hypothetical protein